MALAALCPAPAAAAAEAGAQPETSDEWEPPIADAGEHDWIRLTTGEWLKGTVKLIEDDKVDFDSAQFDEIEIDWKDVAALRMPHPHTFRFTGRRIVLGVGEMRGEVIHVRVGDRVEEYERKDLVSMIRGTGRELDFWSLDLSVGLSGQMGNTDQLSFNTSLDLSRETALTRTSLGYTGNVATQEDSVSANNHRANADFDIYLTRRLYLVVATIDAFQDEFQNISLRLTPGAGVGYDLIWTHKVRWKVAVAMGYQWTRYISVTSGSDSAQDAAIQLNANLDVDLPNRFEWTLGYQPQIVATDIGKTNQHLTSTLSFDFWGPLDFDTTFQWDWVASPTADAEGNVPESSDFRIVVSLALDI